MPEHAARTRDLVDRFTRVDDLVVAQQPPVRIVEGRTREQRHLGVAVQVDLFKVVLELVALQDQRNVLQHVRVPVLGSIFAQTQQAFLVEIVAHEVRLVVKDELPFEPLGTCIGHIDIGGLRLGHVPDRTEDLVHGQECGRHARSRLEEAAPVHIELGCVLIGEFFDATFHLTLLLRLRHRVVFAVGNNLRRHRRWKCGIVGCRGAFTFFIT